MKLSDPLFQPLQLGDIPLANRVVMAPMTRSRAVEGDVPTDLHVAHHRDRASAGLIITEGTQPNADGKGYCRTSGLHDAVQVEARSRVTAAVYGVGRRIVAQLMHVGRVASHHNEAPGGRTVAPSAQRARGRIFTDTAGVVDFDTPHALAGDKILAVIDEQRSDAWGGSAPRRRRFVVELDAFGLARLDFSGFHHHTPYTLGANGYNGYPPMA